MIRKNTQVRRGNTKTFAAVAVLVCLIIIAGIIFMMRSANTETLPNATASHQVEKPKETPKPAAKIPTPAVADAATTQTTAAAASTTPASAAATDAKGVPQWHGKVISAATKKPIAKATVSVHRMMNMLDDPIPAAPLISTVTNDAGEFTIAAATENAGMMPSAIVLRAEADTYATKVTMIMWQQSGSNKTPPDQTIELESGGPISGRVVDEAGAGIGGAAVGSLFLSLPFGPGMASGKVDASSAYTRTDNAGNFTLAGLPAGTEVRFPVSAEGYVGTVSPSLKVGITDARITLKRSNAKVHGKVVTAAGQGVPQARLMGMPMASAQGGDWQQMLAGMGRAKSNEAGEFTMTGLSTGNYEIVAMGESLMEPLAQAQVILAEGDDKEVILTVPAEMEVDGRCIDADSKAPIAGIQFSATPLNFPAGQPHPPAKGAPVYSAGDGTFKLPGVHMQGEQGFMIYYASPAGYIADSAQSEGMMYVQTGGAFTPPYKGDFTFHRGLKLFGNVYLADGTTPAANTNVSATTKGKWRNINIVSAANGSFSMDVLPSESLTIRATNDTGSGAAEVEIPATGMPQTVKITLQAFAQVEGYVRDSDAKGVPGVQLYAMISSFGGSSASSGGSAKSDEKGYYFLDKVPPGKVKVSIQIGQWGQTLADTDPLSKYTAPDPQDLTLAPGDFKKDVDFVLNAGHPFEGTVVDEDDNTPIVGATVSPQMQTSYHPPSTTGADGKFKISGLAEDAAIPYLNVSQKDYNPVNRQSLTMADSPITIKLRKSGTVKLVVRQHGSPAKAFEYRLLSQNGQGSQYVSGASAKVTDSADGTTDLKSITDGDWRVQVQELSETGTHTGRQGSSDFSFAKGKETAQVTVDLDEGRKLTGQVIREDKSALPGATVVVGRAASQNWSVPAVASPFDAGTVTTDAGGNFTVPGVYPGKQRVDVTFEGLQMKEDTTVTVPADRDPEPVVITMTGRGAIFGKVIDRQGKPVANATIQHYFFDSAQQENNQVKTDAQGAYRLENLRAGGHSLQLMEGASNGTASKWEQLKAGEQKEIDFDFSGMIDLSGAITINGKPWDKQNLYLQSIGGDSAISFDHKPEGHYAASIKPGKVGLYLQVTGQIGNSLMEQFDLAADPKVQTHDFNLSIADVSVALVFPRDEDFTPGRISIAHPAQSTADLSNTGYVNDVTKATLTIPYIQPGQYKTTFQSTDGLWTGSAPVTDIVAGQDNIITVDVKKIAEKIEIGEWTTNTVTPQPTAHDFDITPHVSADGEYSVMFIYKSGSKALQISSVALLKNGSQIAIDTHPGWSGYTPRDHIYRLPITGAATPGGSYSVRITWLSEADSNGKVYLLTP